jgi:hypothetical protein
VAAGANQALNAAQALKDRERSSAVSRHHVLPPIVDTPAPPKPKETRRRRNVGGLQGKRALDATDETEEASDIAHATPARTAQGLPQHSTPVEATERRIPSPNGKLSDGTLKAMLEAQETEER